MNAPEKANTKNARVAHVYSYKLANYIPWSNYLYVSLVIKTYVVEQLSAQIIYD